MRYWILVALFNVLFTLVMHFAAPQTYGTIPYYIGLGICSLIALIITWNDPSALLDEIIFFAFKWGALVGGMAFSVWGIDTNSNSGEIVNLMPFLAALSIPSCLIWRY